MTPTTVETFQDLVDRARDLDAADPLSRFRSSFHFPTRNNVPVLYFTGNSLGLQPTMTREAVLAELDDWATLGVEGHFDARHPWFSYHRMFQEPLAVIVGAKPHEVVAMNTLTVNLHLMMVSFYQPTAERYKIIMAASEFPSDRYAIESQVRLHGLDPVSAMIEVQPLPGTTALTTEQIEAAIKEHGSSVALVLFSGVHFYTGQRFDIERIAAAAHAVGAYAGFDLAHAIGNVELKLHEWNADFAVWCSYKYLNSGPGGVGGAFVHERFASRPDLPRLAGWWGNDEKTRFAMEHGFVPTFGADGWQLSNAQVLSMAAHNASLDVFMDAGLDRIYEKRDQLTGLLAEVVQRIAAEHGGVHIITPSARGAQLSISFEHNGRSIFERLIERGVIVDWRTPNVIRVAPAPLYNSYADVVAFGQALNSIIKELA